jgi:SagB-type dehydrogenase family enzyme
VRTIALRPDARVSPELIVSFAGESTIRLTVSGAHMSFATDARALQLLAAIADGSGEQLTELIARHGDEHVDGAIERLQRIGALAGDDDGCLSHAWKDWGEAAWFPHLMTKDTRYQAPAASQGEARARVHSGAPPPSPYKCLCTPAAAVKLPRPRLLDERSLGDVLLQRRTSRFHGDRPVTAQQLADLLFYTGGPLLEQEDEDFGVLLKKCSPSPGSRHPTEIYCALRGGGGLPAGVHHYCTRHHALVAVPGRAVDVAAFLDEALVGQRWFSDAPVVCFFTCVRERLAWKYRSPRAYRVAHLEAGHYCQTLVLVGVSLGLGAFQTGAFDDSLVESTLGVDGVSEFVIYAAGVGHPQPDVAYPRTAVRMSEHLPVGADVRLPGTAHGG